MATRDFIGRGWSYPFGFDARTGGVLKDKGDGIDQQIERIRDSIQQIVGLRRGEMFMMRRRGSTLRDLIFQGNDLELADMFDFAVTKALEDPEFGEKRAFIDTVRVIPDENIDAKVFIEVNFTLRSSNVEGNLVWPLYLEDAERVAAENSTRST